MAVLDGLTGPDTKQNRKKWLRLLTAHGVESADAEDIYKLRCSMLHGYYVPKLGDGRHMYLTRDQHAYALDTSDPGVVKVSVPVFCSGLVERIAHEAKDEWDPTLIDTDVLDAAPSGGSDS